MNKYMNPDKQKSPFYRTLLSIYTVINYCCCVVNLIFCPCLSAKPMCNV